MTFELSPNSRFTLSSNPDVLPGKCAVCGSSGGDNRQFVDFGIQLDVYGAVYFCTHCVTELAEAIGFVAREKFNTVSEAYEDLCAANLRNMNEFGEYKNASRTLLRNCSCGNELDSMLNDSRFGIDAGSANEDSGNPNPESDESSNVEGSGDIRESASPVKRTRNTKAKS